MIESLFFINVLGCASISHEEPVHMMLWKSSIIILCPVTKMAHNWLVAIMSGLMMPFQ